MFGDVMHWVVTNAQRVIHRSAQNVRKDMDSMKGDVNLAMKRCRDACHVDLRSTVWSAKMVMSLTRITSVPFAIYQTVLYATLHQEVASNASGTSLLPQIKNLVYHALVLLMAHVRYVRHEITSA